MERLTELQAALEPRMLRRGYSETLGLLYQAFDPYGDVLGFEAELLRRAEQSGELDPELTVLEVGCGVGNAIESVVRSLPPYLGEEFRIRLRIKGIGVDLNPLPSQLSKEILSISPRTGETLKRPNNKLKSDIHQDDAMTLATIPDNSVDVLFASNVLAYLPDPLRAIETGWRVLKPNGFMVWWTGLESVENPSFQQVLRTTPGAVDVFRTKQCTTSLFYDDWTQDTLTGRKKPGSEFRGFPYKLRESYQFKANPKKPSSKDFAYHCSYDYDGSALRSEK